LLVRENKFSIRIYIFDRQIITFILFRKMRFVNTPGVLSIFLLLQLLSSLPSLTCKEIVATKEWQLLEEGDTIPAGLHVRMNMQTGQKWARLDTEDDDEEIPQLPPKSEVKDNDVAIATINTMGDNTVNAGDGNAKEGDERDKTIKITYLPSDYAKSISPETSTKITSQLLEQERKKKLYQSFAALDDFPNASVEDDSDGKLGVITMYRALLSLPKDETDRMGGELPPLPSSNDTAVDEEVWDEFERAVRTRWETRQAQLKNIEEEFLANAPTIIRDRIEALEGYILSPLEHLGLILAESDSDSNERDDEKEHIDIVWVLDDLDYQLMDIDMARDFHTMGGWPVLVSLLTDSIHGINEVDVVSPKITNSTQIPSMNMNKDTFELVWKIQGLTSSTIGSAVRNIAEFHSWALENFDDLTTAQNSDEGSGDDSTTTQTNVLSILVSKLDYYTTDSSSPLILWQDDDLFLKKIYRELHALGALLRGNRLATYHFTENLNGGVSLSRIADSILRYHLLKHEDVQESTEDSDSTRIGIYTERLLLRIVTLAQDIVMDVTLHPHDTEMILDRKTIDSFTTEEWCSIPLLALNRTLSLFPGRMQNDMLAAALAMAPYCTYKRSDFHYNSIKTSVVDSGEDAEEIDQLEDTWNQFMEVLR